MKKRSLAAALSTAPVISISDLRAAVERAHAQAKRQVTLKRPPDSFTVAEFKRIMNMRETTARVELRSLVEGGTWAKEKVGSEHYYYEIKKETANDKAVDRLRRPVLRSRRRPG